MVHWSRADLLIHVDQATIIVRHFIDPLPAAAIGAGGGARVAPVLAAIVDASGMVIYFTVARAILGL